MFESASGAPAVRSAYQRGKRLAMKQEQDIFTLISNVTDRAPKLPEVYQKLLDALGDAFDKAQKHAENCKDCYHPIIDDEGNPQYLGEACATGATILQAYIDAENALLNHRE